MDRRSAGMDHQQLRLFFFDIELNNTREKLALSSH